MTRCASIGRQDLLPSPSWRQLPGHAAPLPPACLMPLDAGAVDAGSYAACGIACPASIVNSVPQRKKEFLYGRCAAFSALAAIGVRADDIPIGPSREPVWPAGIIGSITHNQHFVAAVALRRGHYSGVGIDLETVSAPEHESALLQIVVSPAEADYLRTLVGPLPLAALLTIVFSAKESLFKGAFVSVGRHFDFSAARVVRIDLEKQYVLLVLQETLSAQFHQARRCTVPYTFIREDVVLSSFAW